MNITELPFNKLINIQPSDDPAYLLMLDDKHAYTNHLGTVHASALFSLAEASGGAFLLIHFPEYDTGLIPVVRQVDVKYRKPAHGIIRSTATLTDNTINGIKEQLATKQRVSLKTRVELYDMYNVNVMTATFEWFVALSDISR